MHDVLVAEALLAEMCRKDNTLSLAKILDEDALVHMDHLILEFDDYF